MRAVIDFESRSTVDLKTTGVWPYAEHPTTSVYWLCYCIGDGEVQSWRPGMADPVDLLEHVALGGVVVAHNAQFEWCIWNLCLRGVHGYQWPELSTAQLDDTMARALVMALPASLDQVTEVLGLRHKKDDAGSRLMKQMAKPAPAALKKGVVKWYDDAERLERLRVYCVADVEAERELDRVLPVLSPLERRVWELDQRINQRGVAIDTATARRAHAVVQAEMAAANARVVALTGGAVSAVTNHNALGEWLRSRGVVGADNTQAETIELLLEGEHPDDVREVLEIRRDAGKASVAKLPAMLAQTASDGRAHGLLMYAGAGRTRRWAGRGAQPQNLPRPEFKQKHIDAVIAYLAEGDAAERIGLLYGPPITVLASCLRALFYAAPGRVLTASDLANIEGRVAAWLAGEDWKLQAFRDFDAGTGLDLYKIAYARTFGGNPAGVGDDSDERQIGKVQELFLQYEGGEGAFATGASVYGFDILRPGQKPRPGRKFIPADMVQPAIKGWRAAHPAIKSFWRELNDCAVRAIQNPGTRFETRNGKIAFIRKTHFMFMSLPNGRDIPYFKPHLADGKFGLEVRYWGVDSKTKRWASLGTYGGKLFENCLTGDTEVLTLSGWKRLDSVEATDLVFDGVEFVRHGGVVFSGFRKTVELDGVRMTPDHRVLTTEGWRNASSCEGFDRAEIAPLDRATLRRFERQKIAVGCAVRLRHDQANGRYGVSERQGEILRLCEERGHPGGRDQARQVRAPGLLGVAVNVGPLHAADAPGVEELRGPRHNRLSRMVGVRRVLARHGTELRSRPDTGPAEQFWRVFAGQLPLGGHQNAGPEHAPERDLSNPVGEHDGSGGVGAEWCRGDDAPLSTGAGGFTFGPCVETGRSEQVFDILNCGPRKRFVVKGRSGPFTVHNCVQAIARDIFAEGLLRAEDAGMPIVMHVHDAAVTEHVPGQATAADLARHLCDIGPVYAGLPVAAKGYTGDRFQK